MSQDWSQWLTWLPFGGGSGDEIPPREFGLTLDLPTAVVRSKRVQKQKKLEPPPDFWRELNEHPIELLRKIDRYLYRLNTERISPAKRIQWVEHALQYACPAIRKVYSDQYKEDALPESHDRREGLVAAINVCGQLATGYKHQLSLDFALSDRRYARVRGRVRTYALRILELIRMEQRLRALRYQKLPAKTWLDCNRIFFAVSQCEDIDASYQALPCLQVYLDRNPDDLERRLPTMTSLNLVYLAIQLNGLLDTNTISSRKLHFVDAQINRVINSLTMIPDHGKPLSRGKVIVYGDQDCPVFFKRQDEKQLQQQTGAAKAGENQESILPILRAKIIDVSPLDASLMAAHNNLLARFESADVTRGKTKKAKAVTDQDDMTHLLTVDVMCDRLHLKRRKEEREYVIGQKILYVYNGFMSVYKLLVDMAEEDNDVRTELVAHNELRDALAGRSALIASDVEAAEFGQWFVIDRSEGGVHIKTRESQFTTALFIGQLVAFSFSREELQQPTLGYVLRLSRGIAGDIEVTLRILAQQAEATAVQSEFLSKNDMALPAILLPDRRAVEETGEQGDQRLVLHHSHRLSPGASIEIEAGGQQHCYYITDLLRMQREFVVYNVRPGDKPGEE